jgi:type II secretory pathway pseudopilin PulG
VRRGDRKGFSLIEALLALFLIGLTIGLIGALFQRSFVVLRQLDDKERARQASRMGLDRITSELREATEFITVGADLLEFEKIDPTQEVVLPPEPPKDSEGRVVVPDDYVPPPWTPEDAYPDDRRLIVSYTVEAEVLIRTVRRKSGPGSSRQVVVVGVNAFNSEINPDNEAEIDVTIAVRDNRRVSTVSSRVLAPCILVEFE